MKKSDDDAVKTTWNNAEMRLRIYPAMASKSNEVVKDGGWSRMDSRGMSLEYHECGMHSPAAYDRSDTVESHTQHTHVCNATTVPTLWPVGARWLTA